MKTYTFTALEEKQSVEEDARKEGQGERIWHSCPFCSGEGLPDKTLRDGYQNCQDDPEAYAHFIICRSCAAQGGWAKNPAGAIRWWNMRQPCPSCAALAAENEGLKARLADSRERLDEWRDAATRIKDLFPTVTRIDLTPASLFTAMIGIQLRLEKAERLFPEGEAK